MIDRAASVPDTAADTFLAQIDRTFHDRADRVFAQLPSGPMTYAECRAEMLRLVAVFARIGLAPGDRALIRSVDDGQVITFFLAMLRSGIVPVIADAQATDAECTQFCNLCDVRAVFADEALATVAQVEMVTLGAGAATYGRSIRDLKNGAHVQEFPRLDHSPEVALLVLTSGTTSTPKAVELTHANLVAQLAIFEQVYGFGADTRLLNLLPLHHVDGLIRGPLATLWTGGTLVRPMPFSVQAVPEILATIGSARVTHFISVPAMLRIIERVGAGRPDAFRVPGFAFVLSSADVLDEALWRRFEDRFGVPLVNAYGLSEVVCDALFAGPEAATRRIGTLGRPVGCTARVVDDAGREVPQGATGELVLSGPTIARGYFGAPDETAMVFKAGAFHTGDYVRVTAENLFQFVGRKKTAIVSAGQTIHPEAATQALSLMPGVLEAFAFGVPDAAMGERLVAAIVPAPGYEITAADAARHCRSLLSVERSPREYRIVQALPRGAAGKVLIADLLTISSGPEPQAASVLEVAASCFNVPVETLSPESTYFNTEGWDSLAHMTLIEALEQAFGIQFTAIQIAQIMSLGEAETFVAEQRAALRAG